MCRSMKCLIRWLSGWVVLGGLDQACHVCSGNFKWLNINHSCSNIARHFTCPLACQVLLRRGAWDSWVTAKARLELDPRSHGATGTGGVRLQLFRKRLTTSQDARFTAGLDWDYNGSGSGLKQVSAGDPRPTAF